MPGTAAVSPGDTGLEGAAIIVTGASSGIGAATALIYNLFKHEKQVVLVGGMHLTFVVNHSVQAEMASDDTPDAAPDEK